MRHLSVFYQDQEILKAISEIFLRNNEWYDADITYSKGVFWEGIPQPKYRSDLIPQAPGVTQDDSTVLATYADNSLKSVVFDPPFLFRNRKAENNDKMCKRFSYFKTYAELFDMYAKTMDSVHKKLVNRGFLIFKCQDMTDGRFYCTHNDIINYATKNGYLLKDIILKVSKTKLQRDAKQQNCVAKVHSYFLVFQKIERYETTITDIYKHCCSIDANCPECEYQETCLNFFDNELKEKSFSSLVEMINNNEII